MLLTTHPQSIRGGGLKHVKMLFSTAALLLICNVQTLAMIDREQADTGAEPYFIWSNHKKA